MKCPQRFRRFWRCISHQFVRLFPVWCDLTGCTDRPEPEPLPPRSTPSIAPDLILQVKITAKTAKIFSTKNFKKLEIFFKKLLTKRFCCGIIVKSSRDDAKINRFLGVAQLVARYLGVVEAASSSLVTQTKIGGSTEPPIFFYFLA